MIRKARDTSLDVESNVQAARGGLAGSCATLTGRLELVRRRKLACLAQALPGEEVPVGSDVFLRQQAPSAGKRRG